MGLRIAINGFGRIGRAFLRLAWNDPEVEIVHINDLTDAATLAHLLAYDSVHGVWSEPVAHEEGALLVGGDVRIPVTSERNPANLPYGALNVDIVVECTGVFRSREACQAHLDAGARRVIISAPGKAVDATFVMGVNHTTFDPAEHVVVSNASCTTNCLAPAAKVLHDRFGIVRGMMTTIHSYTMDQNLLDAPHRKGDMRRARAAALNMVPTTTGAATAVSLVIPELKGRLNGMAVRVPTPDGSLVDLTIETSRAVTAEEVNAALQEAAAGPLSGVLQATHAPLVSSDIIGNTHSAIADLSVTDVIGDTLVKLVLWYDNEIGFTCRLLDLARHIGSQL